MSSWACSSEHESSEEKRLLKTAESIDFASVDYERDVAGDRAKKTFLENVGREYRTFSGKVSPGLRRQMALFAADCETMAWGFFRLAANETELAQYCTQALAERHYIVGADFSGAGAWKPLAGSAVPPVRVTDLYCS